MRHVVRVAVRLAVRDVAVDLDAALPEEVVRDREVRQHGQHPVGELDTIAAERVVVVEAVGPVARHDQLMIEPVGAARDVVDHTA